MRNVRWIAASLALVALLGACSSKTTNTTTTTTPATDSAPPAAANAVEAKDFSFQPKNLDVKVGSEVTWSFTGEAPHTVTADDGSFDSKTLNKGAIYKYKFTKAGTIKYYCTIHGGKGGKGMSGTIVVS